MDILQDQANGMNMEYVKMETFEIRLCQWIEGFVDDTSIFANLEFGNNNLSELLTIIQVDGQLWEQLLHTTGGELELSKCFYYILMWRWEILGNPIPQTIEEQNIEKLEIILSQSNKKQELVQ
jgi:hypothetical protein